jgi:hypothetical protein
MGKTHMQQSCETSLLAFLLTTFDLISIYFTIFHDISLYTALQTLNKVIAPRSPTEETRQRGGPVLRSKSSKETGEKTVSTSLSERFCDRIEKAETVLPKRTARCLLGAWRQCRPRSHSLRLGRPRSHRLQLDRASSSSREWSTSRAPETSTQPRISSSPTCSRSASKSTLITPRCRSRMPAASLHVQSRAVCNCQIGRRQMSRLLQRDQRKWNACDFFMAHPRVLSPLCWHALPSAHLNFMRCTIS